MSAEAGGPLAQRGNGHGTCRHQPSSQIRIPLGDFSRIQGWWVSLNIHSFLSSIKILPSVILSDSEGFPRSGRPRGSRRTPRMFTAPCCFREFYRGSARISYGPTSQQLRMQNAWVEFPEATWRENAFSGSFDLRLSRLRRTRATLSMTSPK